MLRILIPATLAIVSVMALGPAASADTLRCRSVNGNVTCAGSGAVSCQTINGQKTCVSGKGDVVQSFGSGTARDGARDRDEDADDGPDGDMPPDVSGDMSPGMSPGARPRPQPRAMFLERDGTRLHLRTGSLMIDRN